VVASVTLFRKYTVKTGVCLNTTLRNVKGVSGFLSGSLGRIVIFDVKKNYVSPNLKKSENSVQ